MCFTYRSHHIRPDLKTRRTPFLAPFGPQPKFTLSVSLEQNRVSKLWKSCFADSKEPSFPHIYRLSQLFCPKLICWTNRRFQSLIWISSSTANSTEHTWHGKGTGI